MVIFSRMEPGLREVADEHRSRLLRLLAFVATCGVVAIVASAFVAWDANFVAKEVIKASLQLLVIVVIGALLKLFADLWQFRRDQLEAHQSRQQARQVALREIRTTLLKNLLLSYNTVKQVRRTLNARGFLSECILNKAETRQFYDDKMLVISEAELALESLVKQFKAGAGPFSEAVGHTVQSQIAQMYNYLNDGLQEVEPGHYIEHGGVVKEYRKNMPAIWRLQDGEPWPTLPQLQEFLTDTSRSRFYSEFADPFGAVRHAIGRDLLNDTAENLV